MDDLEATKQGPTASDKAMAIAHKDEQTYKVLEGEANTTEVSLLQLVALFATVGMTAFGGGVPVHILDSFSRRGWLTEKEYLEAFNWCQCLPGPNVSNLSTFLGWRFKGFWGALLCPIVLLLPGAAMVLLASELLARMPQQPVVQGALNSVAAAAVGLLLGALWRLAAKALLQRTRLLAAVVTFVLVGIFSVPTYLVIVSIGLILYCLDKKGDTGKT
jgi:chromate transporter